MTDCFDALSVAVWADRSKRVDLQGLLDRVHAALTRRRCFLCCDTDARTCVCVCIPVWLYCVCCADRLENTLNYGMERIWAIGVLKGSNSVAFGFDEGLVVVKIGA